MFLWLFQQALDSNGSQFASFKCNCLSLNFGRIFQICSLPSVSFAVNFLNYGIKLYFYNFSFVAISCVLNTAPFFSLSKLFIVVSSSWAWLKMLKNPVKLSSGFCKKSFSELWSSLSIQPDILFSLCYNIFFTGLMSNLFLHFPFYLAQI